MAEEGPLCTTTDWKPPENNIIIVVIDFYQHNLTFVSLVVTCGRVKKR